MQKKIIKRIFIILAISAAALQVGVSGQGPATDLSSQANLVTEFDVNGMKVLVKRRPNSATVAAGLFFRGGTKNLTPQNAGIESFALNVATEGSAAFPRIALRRELASTGSNISAGANYDYSAIALATTRENFDRSWNVFVDVALHPAFVPEDVELTREKILTALRDDEDDPDGFLQVLVNRTINAKTPYANDPSGTIETITKFKAADLRAYHQSMLQASRLLLVIVGDLDAAALKKRITDSFGKLPRGNYKDTPSPGFDFSKPTLDVTQRALPTNYVQGIFSAPSISSPDFFAMRVATTILRDRVFEEVRVKRNLSYAPNADMGNLAANTGNIYVSAVDANQAIRVMLDEINKLKTTAVDPADISGVAGQFLTTYFIGQETNAAQAAELARYELIGGGWRNSFQFLNRVREVKPADVQAVAKKYINNIRFVVLGNPTSIDRAIFLQAQPATGGPVALRF
ncbi:MAG: M16 family metallopeptidase [Pyrinomonadaceae bacterium]